jgi:putative ABC transport system permease protein
VGSRLRAAGHQLLVTGIIAPRQPASSFWTVDPVVPAPRLTYPSPDSAPYFSAAAFIGPAQLPALQHYLPAQPLRARWSFPLGLAGVTADQAAGLLRAARAVSYLPAASSVSTSLSNTAGSSATIDSSLSSGLSSILPSFVATDDAVQRVLSLLLVSLAVVAAVVVLLGARLVAEHRRNELALMRARGAALRQVAGIALGGGAVAVLPAAAVAAGAAVAATSGPASWLSWWLAGPARRAAPRRGAGGRLRPGERRGASRRAALVRAGPRVHRDRVRWDGPRRRGPRRRVGVLAGRRG